MKKTAVIGASGYIGKHLYAKYRETYSDCIGTAYSRANENLIQFDLRHPEAALLKLEETGHEAVIIASAMPLVGWCEAHPKESYELNVSGTLKLAEQLAKRSMDIYFLSSDYVFDGKNGGYTDSAKTCPVTEYGRQKAEVEHELPKITDNYTILRLSKIYGTTWKDGTLIDDIASSLIQGNKIKVATDQFFSPTHVDDVVRMVLYIQANNIKGLVNLCHSNRYSRYQIAVKLVEALDLPLDLLSLVSLHSIQGMENRPLDTSILCSRSLEHLQSSLCSVDDAINRIAKNWTASQLMNEAAS